MESGEKNEIKQIINAYEKINNKLKITKNYLIKKKKNQIYIKNNMNYLGKIQKNLNDLILIQIVIIKMIKFLLMK